MYIRNKTISIAPCEVIQEVFGFWIPLPGFHSSADHSLDSGFHSLDSLDNKRSESGIPHMVRISSTEKEGHCIENDESVVGVHVIDLSVITSQLHGSEAEGPKRMPIRVCFGPSASLPCSCDVLPER